MRTVIVGNGIIAQTIAFRLCQTNPAEEIVIIGPSQRSGSATLAAGAMLNSFGEIEAGSLTSDVDLFRFELSHLATRMWPKFEEEIIAAAGSCLPHGCSRCQGFRGGGCVALGTYVIDNAAADGLDDENFDAILQALKDFDEPFEQIAPADIPNYQPDPRRRALRAIYLPNEGWFNPRLMMEKLDAVLTRQPKVAFLDTSITSLHEQNAKISGLTTQTGERIEGDRYVLAVGASLTRLIESAGLGNVIQKIFHGVGVSIELSSSRHALSHCIRTPNRGLACGIYAVPYFTDPDGPNDHVLIGATNLISPEPRHSPRLIDVADLLKAARQQISDRFYNADIQRINVGWRPVSLDGYPLIGKTSLANLLVVSGTKRDGFHLSPVISSLIVSMLQDMPVDERIVQFAPEREPIRALDRRTAIDKTVRHWLSAAYQHGYSASTPRVTEQLIQAWRDDLERLHDRIGALDWGIPPEMVDMYRHGHFQ